MTLYEEMRDVADEMLAEFAQGTVSLKRIAYAEPENPWEQGSETETIFTLDATVRGVAQKYVDGTLILASDLQVMCAVTARDEAGAAVDIAPQMSDEIIIDGAAKSPKRILPIPAAGTPAAFLIFVAA